MRTLVLTLLASSLLALAHPGCTCAGDAEARFVWPAPQGWKTETIPFPLDFAPDLPYRGVEEIRFAPAFFDPEAPGYFSYAFAWWLEDSPALEQTTVEHDLVRYFTGLCKAVGGDKHAFDPKRFKATLAPSGERPAGRAEPARSYTGSIDTYDPFEKGNGRELTLNVDVAIWDCPTAGRRVLLAQASPKPRTDPIWRDLAERAAAFRCQP